jgi:cob(I)alamin adenosyltransferase
MNKIYTKKGDKGKTKTFGGPISKADQLAVALGTIDELNSWIGVCRQMFSVQDLVFNKNLQNMQTNLMIINSIIAGSKKYSLKGAETARLEKIIDKLQKDLPELTNFVYPMGFLQVARAVARRAEREVITISQDKNILKYLNRLSDALFVMARYGNQKQGIFEEVWK